MKKFAVALPLMLTMLFFASWGYKGHQAIAIIAENHLSPDAKKAVAELLGSQSLSDISTWADEVRDDPAYAGTVKWHFLNLPLGLSYSSFTKAVKEQEEDNLYAALEQARIVLVQSKSSRAQCTEALKFLVHFVGDAHQPMHVSRAEDKGGNMVQVRFDNKGTNLHALWDSKLIDHQGLSVPEMARQYDHATAVQIKAWQEASPMEWLYESYQISSQLYAEIETNGANINEVYYKKHIPVI